MLEIFWYLPHPSKYVEYLSVLTPPPKIYFFYFYFYILEWSLPHPPKVCVSRALPHVVLGVPHPPAVWCGWADTHTPRLGSNHHPIRVCLARTTPFIVELTPPPRRRVGMRLYTISGNPKGFLNPPIRVTLVPRAVHFAKHLKKF